MAVIREEAGLDNSNFRYRSAEMALSPKAYLDFPAVSLSTRGRAHQLKVHDLIGTYYTPGNFDATPDRHSRPRKYPEAILAEIST